MSSPGETQFQHTSSASAPTSVGRGERMMAAASGVKEVAQWMLENHPQALVERVEAQACRIAELERQLEANQQEIATLRSDLAEAKRAGKRQAAPFRIAPEKRKGQRKRAGRKAGHPGTWRERPPDEAVDEHIEVPLGCCPECGETLDAAGQRAIEQTLIEVPPVKPRVIRLRTYRHHCDACQCEVESRHPLQVSRAVGAAGTQLGPRALGIAATLHQQLGLPMRKTTQVLEQLLGLKLSAGGLAQALQRVGERLQADYEELLVKLQTSNVLHIDETGWWVSGPGYWLWVLTNEQGTYYRIVPNRNRETAASLIGEEFAGVLVSDCLNIYDDLNPIQHKCYAHHLKVLSEALKTPAGKGSAYLLELRALLHIALLLKQCQPLITAELFAEVRQILHDRSDVLLASLRGDPSEPRIEQEERVRQRLYKQQDHLFTFLDYEAVDGTNNQAERQLRPAIVSRKVSCGNKSEAGARTWEILASLAATCAQQGQSFIDYVAQAVVIYP